MVDICADSTAFLDLRATLNYEDRIALEQSMRLGCLANKEADNKPYWFEKLETIILEERRKYKDSM
jgi:hypothetical protein